MSDDTTVPMLDLAAGMAVLEGDIQRAVDRVLKSCRFIMGPDVEAFEDELADYIGVEHAVAVSSGTDALVLGLRALGIGPDDEVITTPFSFSATLTAILRVGAVPVFADIDPDTFNIDPHSVRQKISARTRAVIPVHLYGQPADMDSIQRLAAGVGAVVLEDAAQALGALFNGKAVGTIGDAAALSFFPSKNLGACGDAGMLVTRDEATAEAARVLRVHGARRKYLSEIVGYNARMDTLQAAILRVKLPHLASWLDARRAVAGRYDELLAEIPGVIVPRRDARAVHGFHQYTVRILGGKRQSVRETMSAAGVATAVYYPTPLHLQPIHAAAESLPVAELAAEQVLSLPIWPEIDLATQQRVAKVLRTAVL